MATTASAKAAAGEEEHSPGQEQQDRTRAHLLPSSCPIQTLHLRPSRQCGHLRPQHRALHLQREGGGALVQQVSTVAPGWGPLPLSRLGSVPQFGGWCRAGIFTSVGHCCSPSPYTQALTGALWWEPCRVTPCRGAAGWQGNGAASLWTTGTGSLRAATSVPPQDAAVVPCCSACPMPPALVSSPCPDASQAGLTCSPTTPLAAPAASAMATPPSARQQMATR